METTQFNLQQLRAAIDALAAGATPSGSQKNEGSTTTMGKSSSKKSSLQSAFLLCVIGTCAAAMFGFIKKKLAAKELTSEDYVDASAVDTKNADSERAIFHTNKTLPRMPTESPFSEEDIIMNSLPESYGLPPPANADVTASRKDLVQFAKDHASYYAAQGVPEQEAMVYITKSIREVVEAKQYENESNFERPQQQQQPLRHLPLPVATAPMSSFKINGPLPLVGRDKMIEEFDSGGRRKKMSSESKEVEEYMKRRQKTLGISETSPLPYTYPNENTAAVDPGETML
jgi:hypothetical protein